MLCQGVGDFEMLTVKPAAQFLSVGGDPTFFKKVFRGGLSQHN
jgi:hypothetical protein